MRVAFVSGSVSRLAGGLHTSVRRLAQSVAQSQNVEVSVFALRDAFTESDKDPWHPLVPKAFDIIGPKSFGYAPAISRALREWQPDVVHAQGIWQYPSAAVLGWSKNARKPHLIAPRGMLDPWAVNRSRWKKNISGHLFEHQHLRRAACLHALCAAEAEAIRKYGLKNPLCIIPNGIDLPDLGQTVGPCSSDRRNLVYIGRLHPKKNVPALILAWKELLATNSEAKDWRLQIAGWDQANHERELKDLVNENALANVEFLGPRFGEAKAQLLAGATAVILPSLSEGLPMSVLEAWAYSKPVAITPECNLPEGFEAEAAIRIQSGVDEIVDGLRKMVEMTPRELEEMGARGLKLVRERFSWNQIATETRAVYHWLLGSGAAPDCVVHPTRKRIFSSPETQHYSSKEHHAHSVSKGIKVACLTGSISRQGGGIAEALRGTSRILREKFDADIHVMALSDAFSDVDRARWHPVTVQLFPLMGSRSFGFSPDLKRGLAEVKADITHVHGLWMYPSVLRKISNKRDARHIITPQGMLDAWALNHSRYKKKLAGWFYENAHLASADCLHAVSDSEARSMRAYGLRNAICIIPNGVDLPDLEPEEALGRARPPCAPSLDQQQARSAIVPHPTNEARSAIGPYLSNEARPAVGPYLSKEARSAIVPHLTNEARSAIVPYLTNEARPAVAPYLLYLGRIHPKKNLKALIQAWRLARTENSKGKEWNLQIAGWDQGGYEADLKRQVDELQLADSVRFLGPCFGGEKAAAYSDASAFVLPSLSEGLPMVVLEAWAYAKPVLMTPECNLPEGYTANAAIRLGTSAEGIAAGLHNLFDMSNDDRSQMGRRGRALVEQKFTWPKVAAEMKAVYEWVLGGGPPPSSVCLR